MQIIMLDLRALTNYLINQYIHIVDLDREQATQDECYTLNDKGKIVLLKLHILLFRGKKSRNHVIEIKNYSIFQFKNRKQPKEFSIVNNTYLICILNSVI